MLFYYVHVAKCNSVNLEPMCPGFSTICGVVTMACLAIHLHVGSNRHLYLQSSVQLIFVNKATLDESLFWSITIFAVFLLS